MIAPALAIRALVARLDRMPALLRTALASELGALAQRRNSTASIDAISDTITATFRTASLPPPRIRTAGLRPALPAGRRRSGARRLRAIRVSSASSALNGFSFSDVRAALEAAAREALSP